MSFRIFLKYKYTQKYKDFTGLSKIIIFADPDGTTFCGMKHGNVKIEKTNAARLLDRAKIAYELIPYRVDEEHLAATHVPNSSAKMLLRFSRRSCFVVTGRAISSVSSLEITRSI